MTETALLANTLVVGAALVAVGLAGFAMRRNMIVMFLCVELMLQGVGLSLVAWGRYHQDWGAQMLVLMIITVAACEAGVGLAIVLGLFRWSGSLDVARWQELREEGQQPYVDREAPEARAPEPAWPRLPLAGAAPPPEQLEEPWRPRV